MLDLRCEWAVVDVVSALGTDQNVTAHVSKWPIDGAGIRQRIQPGANNKNDITLKDDTVTESIEELHANGEDAVSLDQTTLQFAKDENEYLFVDFYASWCNHCRDLAPTWEKLAELIQDAGERLGNQHPDDIKETEYEEATKVEIPVMVAKVDCVTHPEVCNKQEDIRAYPTLRLFVDGERWKGGDYRGHRTLIEMVEWLSKVEMVHKDNLDDREKKLHIAHEGMCFIVGSLRKPSRETHTLFQINSAARERLGGDWMDDERKWYDNMVNNVKNSKNSWVDAEHPGCILSGYLLVDRTPGNFHIQARSQNQEFAAHMTNASHIVNSLFIGEPAGKFMLDKKKGIKFMPEGLTDKIESMNNMAYVTRSLHESYHHYLKLISTKIEGLEIRNRQVKIFQMLGSSQLAYYRNDMIPEAKFIYDLSPIAVSYRTESRRWYDYCTSIMAIVGGVFTVVGMLESSIHATVKAAKRRNTYKR